MLYHKKIANDVKSLNCLSDGSFICKGTKLCTNKVSLMYAATSVALTLACFAVGWSFSPIQALFLSVWALYVIVTGTVATGCWVIAHECGNGAFSNKKLLQSTVGYVIHTALLVPYMSWQRSHAVHHAFTNRMTLGESHVHATLDQRI
jgi:fatty acid desaturase